MSLAVTTLAGLEQNVWDGDVYARFRNKPQRMRGRQQSCRRAIWIYQDSSSSRNIFRPRRQARRLVDLTPARDQVIDQDDHRDDQHDVNQAAADVADESQ